MKELDILIKELEVYQGGLIGNNTILQRLFAVRNELTEQLTTSIVSNRRETLLDYEEWINDYKTLEERENQVDKYLSK